LEAVDGRMTAGAGQAAASGPEERHGATGDAGMTVAAGEMRRADGNRTAKGPQGPQDGRMTAGANQASSGGMTSHEATNNASITERRLNRRT